MTTDFEPVPSDNEEVEDLVWSLLDDHISADEFQRLEGLLGADEDARRLYLECVQLHVDLREWFNPRTDVVGRVPAVPPLDVPLPGDDSSLADSAL